MIFSPEQSPCTQSRERGPSAPHSPAVGRDAARHGAFVFIALALWCVAALGADSASFDDCARERERCGTVLLTVISMPDDAVPPSTRGEAIRLAGYLRPSDPRLLACLCSKLPSTTLPNGGYVDARRAATVFPTTYAIAEVGLPAVAGLLSEMRKPLRAGVYRGSRNSRAREAFGGFMGHCGAAVIEFARDAEPDRAAATALDAAVAACPREFRLSLQELLPRTFDLPEPYKLYTDPEELKHALLSEDDATRHAALSGVLRTYKEHAKALTDLIAVDGPADLDVIEAIGQLRPRQEEAVQAVLGELLETVRHEPLDQKHEEALVTALARIGCPGVRACVNLLKTDEDKRVEKACVRVLWFALGQFGDDWLLAEAQYGDRHQDYAEKLTQVAERWKRLFKGGGIWNLS